MGKREKKQGVLDLRFQANLKAFRKNSGMKQRELAERMNWENENFVSQIERGFIGVSFDMVEELATVFKVDPGEFFLHAERRRFLRTVFDGVDAEGKKGLREGKGNSLIKKLRKEAIKAGLAKE